MLYGITDIHAFFFISPITLGHYKLTGCQNFIEADTKFQDELK